MTDLLATELLAYRIGDPCPTCASGRIGQSGHNFRCANCGWLGPRIHPDTPERGGPSYEGTARADDRGERATGETGDDRPAAPVSLSSNPRVRLLKDIPDCGQDHHPPGYYGRKGEVLVVRTVGNLGVSHEHVEDRQFFVHEGEYEFVAPVETTGEFPQLKELASLLKSGSIAAGYSTEMWTVPRISALIQQRFGIKLVDTSVWRTLRRMGWSVQRPARQARQRDEKAISTWKRKRWPELKKSLRDSDESSSL